MAKVAQCFYEVIIPKISVVNPVGSGDATLAGLANALSKRQSIEEIYGLRHGKRATRENWLDRPYESYDVDETHSS